MDSKEVKPVSPKGNQPWIFIGRTDTVAEAQVLWPPDEKSWLTGKNPYGERGEGGDEGGYIGWHHWLNGQDSEQTQGDSEGQRSLACCSPLGHKESDMT